LWDRRLAHYPDTGARTLYLGITVLATIILYYELNVQGAVATQVLHHYGFSFAQFISVAVIGAGCGAFASLIAGLADRWGRANLVVGGLFITGLLVAVAMPNAHSKTEYTLYFALLSVFEGVTLVATPALIRDFSPQVGRGLAMGFWTLGPVLGSLMVTLVASHTLDGDSHWQLQFQLAGGVGLAVAVIALVFLRELSPQLRDQLMQQPARPRADRGPRGRHRSRTRAQGPLAAGAQARRDRPVVRDRRLPDVLLHGHRRARALHVQRFRL
jgi:MFS family permease